MGRTHLDPAAGARGFTLVEVLVALSIMAVLATMAWQGIDAMARTREISAASVERTLRLQTAIAQWERDLQAIQDTHVVPALRFDGARLLVTREAEGGIQLVAWQLRAGAWWRWAGPPVTRADDLQDHWLRAQQLLGNEPGTLQVLDDVQAMQVYAYRGSGWTNVQSSGDVVAPPAAGASAPAAAPTELLPSGVRLVLTLSGRTLVRDLALPPQMP